MASPSQMRSATRGRLRGLRDGSLQTTVAAATRYTDGGLVEMSSDTGRSLAINFSPYLPRFGADRAGVISNGVVGFLA